MKVSIIIPTSNHLKDLLVPCLDSIIKYTDLSDKEIVIVSNGSTDETPSYIDYLLHLGLPVNLLNFPRLLGFPKAINIGVDAAKSEYIILLNNDTIILNSKIDEWINMLMKPFLEDDKVAVTGPVRVRSMETGRLFIPFFCAMIKRSIYEDAGRLDEVFSPGICEDVDFCCRIEDVGYKTVMVPQDHLLDVAPSGMGIVSFPIYHPAGSPTFSDIKNEKKRLENLQIVANRHNHQMKYGNNFERAVFGKEDIIRPNEYARYKWAFENILGTKILEIGCSSGYALKFIDPKKYDYLGIDYDPKIIDFARKQFGPYFYCEDIHNFTFENYDTIIAFEFLEHIVHGKEIAQELKHYCKRIIATCPYKEIPGTLGPHHKIHMLEEKDFPGFKFKYYNESTRQILDRPTKDTFLMYMIWDK